MKIYTRAGDDGRTALFGGGRVSKDDARVSAYGSVDELNAILGWTLTQVGVEATRAKLLGVQHDLFAVGAELATPPAEDGRKRPLIPTLPVDRVAEMEAWMDDAHEALAPLKAFVLPGGTVGAAALHVARTVCRRAERAVVRLSENEPVDGDIVKYLNRLSDLLFTLARVENRDSGQQDVEWVKPSSEDPDR